MRKKEFKLEFKFSGENHSKEMTTLFDQSCLMGHILNNDFRKPKKFSRNPNRTSYVDWLIAVVDKKIPEPPTKPMSSIRTIA